MMVTKRNICLGVTAFLGVAFLAIGLGMIKYFDDLIHKEIREKIPLKKGTDTYKAWQEPSSPIYFQIFVFNLLNPDEVQNGGRPHVNQMGPYTYRERRVKKDIVFHDNGTVQYREDQFFVFNRKMSAGAETDRFTTVNLPMFTIMNLLRNEYKVIKYAVDVLFREFNETLFLNLSVHDLIWGYPDNLLKEAAKIAKDFNITLPVSDKFGLFMGKNGSDDGLYLVDSGNKGIKHFGEVYKWNGESDLNYWTTKIANMINGSDGTIYPPWVDTSTSKYLFSSDLCRSIYLDYNQKTSVRGIPLLEFVAPDIMFGNVTVNPYNKGYCTPPGQCLPTGLLNVSACRAGAPVVMSQPHFLGCDPDVQDFVKGIHPIRLDHQSHLDLEPMTGVVFQAAKRLQINTHLEKISGFESLDKIQTFYMPILWLNESAVIDKSDADKFKSDVLDMLKVADAVKYGLIAIGAFMLVCVICVLLVARVRTKNVENRTINSGTSEEDDPLLIGNGGSDHNGRPTSYGV